MSWAAQSENGWVPAQSRTRPSSSATGTTSARVPSRSARASATVEQMPVMSSMFDSMSSFLAFGWGSPRPFSSRWRIALAPLRSSREVRSTICSSTSTPRLDLSEAWNRMSTGRGLPARGIPENAFSFILPKQTSHSRETSCRKPDPRFGAYEREDQDGGEYRLGTGVGGAGAVHDPGPGLLLRRDGPVPKRTPPAHAELFLPGAGQRALGVGRVQHRPPRGGGNSPGPPTPGGPHNGGRARGGLPPL